MKRTQHVQRGVTMLVVLVLLSVMLLGGLALARMTEVGTLASGNAAFREAALQASEVGVNTAFAAVQALANENVSVAPWYYATTQALDANGVPTVNFDNAAEVVVGAYNVRYVVDRICNGVVPVLDSLRQCLVRQVNSLDGVGGGPQIDPPNARQFRITVRVIGPKDTTAWVQAMMTKG